MHVVDEAVLAVASYMNPNPLSVFYPKRRAEMEMTRSRPQVMLARPRAHDGRQDRRCITSVRTSMQVPFRRSPPLLLRRSTLEGLMFALQLVVVPPVCHLPRNEHNPCNGRDSEHDVDYGRNRLAIYVRNN